MPNFCLCCIPCISLKSLLNHLNSFCGGMFTLNAKFDAYLLLYLLSHCECNVHMLTHWGLPPPLTSTVKSSLFTHVYYSPLSLAARLHQFCTNHSHYINNGWTFSGQTSCMYCLSLVNFLFTFSKQSVLYYFLPQFFKISSIHFNLKR